MAKTSIMVKSRRKQRFGVRSYNRCPICGRPRAYMRRFDMCRICFRKRALNGELPGIIKSSW
ncbi:MAG TPA: type Z 30S ribosomal protein S14 [bacterium]|nr:type Z 30S ribosomal protein S14 [Myxococcales bacterium]OQA58621.1 MAG: 30S ribosomal protein S14 type Z [bacterium ADurb.Bin270]HPW45367.1 type Z 30S ribosomal protein S14 [bacterium]HQG13164.1 type Z 30S ribosomal protein S14 [bacterium]